MNVGVIIAIVVVAIVVITIIVAAVLYVMVIGFGSGGSGYTTPAGSWSSSDATSYDSGQLRFGMFSSDVAPMDLRIFMYENGTQLTTLSWYSNTGYAPTTMNENPNIIGLDVEYYDLNAAGGLINSGDYIDFDGLKSGSTYTFTVFHIPTDSQVSMTGDDGRIITP